VKLLLVALLALAVAACGRGDWPEPAPAIWRVSGPEAGQTGWLFGTIHALPDGVQWRSPQVGDALSASDVLVVEVATLGDAEEAGDVLARRAHSPGMPPLLQRVPAADRPALAAALARAGLAEPDLAGLESWAAALTLANASRGGDTANGVDRALLAERVTGNRAVIGLESMDEQLGLFDTLPETAQQRLLMEVARDPGGEAEAARTRAWLEGDLAKLEADAAGGLLADPVLRETLQTGRNRAWAGTIDRLLQDGRRPFVAVGAAHMVGPEGLPALLAARGYRVTRLR